MTELIKTGVDELLDLLKGSSKLQLLEVAKKLNVSVDVIQAWVDFLVEEGIVGIEYKFTTPYIYLNKPLQAIENKDDQGEAIDFNYFKKQFWEKAKKNNIPDATIGVLWKNHMLQEVELKKKYFYFEAQRRKILKIDELWADYTASITRL